MEAQDLRTLLTKILDVRERLVGFRVSMPGVGPADDLVKKADEILQKVDEMERLPLFRLLHSSEKAHLSETNRSAT